jgi:acyl transferase domain-containing protein/acyl carrier protein
MDHAAPDSFDVAIIGYDGRFPGARNAQELWQNVRDGVHCIRQFSAAELDAYGVPAADLQDPSYVRAASVLDDVEYFDAAFFGVPPREAEIMDPQQRLFLEVCWAALEHAGHDPAGFTDRVGVFAGARTNTYLLHLLQDPALVRSVGPFYLGLSNDLGFMTTRLSHALNLTGPSCAVQSACSTSLVAVHLAIRSLLARECRVAIAGGAAVNVPHVTGYLAEDGSVFAPDGTCRVFDAAARGTVFGSAVAVVVLKRLADAVADGDEVHAVIKGSAVNNDGSAKASFTAPAVRGQVAVVEDALRAAGVPADTIGYVEAHGTGTLLGDAIEVRALTRAYRKQTTRTAYCALGSVKSNIGHLDAAAGVTGLIKVVECLKHQRLVPSLHYREPNPQIEFEGSPFYVNTAAVEWPRGDTPRRAAVSAFGVGGTNAHVIVEEAPSRERSGAGRPWQVLVWSGKSADAVVDAERQLARHLRESVDVPLADVAYTLQVGRQRMAWRRAAVCRDTAEAIAALDAGGETANDGDAPETPTVVFVFPGQGAQHRGMGRALYDRERVFRDQIDRCAELLIPGLGIDLREPMYADRDGDRSLDETWLAQPALFATEYALATLWESWGVRPAAMIGHSLGEYVAACVSGVLTLDDALRLVAVRGRLMQEMPRGAMLAVELGEEAIGGWLGDDAWLAAVNGATTCTVGGAEPAIAALEQTLRAAGIGAQRLPTSHAYHTPMMAGMIDRFVAEIARAPRATAGVPYISNVTGGWIAGDQIADARYWGRQLGEPVRFGSGINTLLADGERLFIEVGPGHGLSRMLRRRGIMRACPSMGRHGGDDTETLLRAVAHAWTAGADVDWARFHAGMRRVRVALPTYPFQRKRFWIDASPVRAPEAPSPASTRIPKIDDVTRWFWTPTWTLVPPAASAPRRARAGERWLLFADDSGLAPCLTRYLQSAGAEVVTVGRGSSADILADARDCTHILHVWGVVPPDQAPDDAAFFDAFQPAAFYSLLRAARELSAPATGTLRRCWVVSNDSQYVDSVDRAHPAKAAAVAFCKVLSQETAVAARFVDVAYRDVAADVDAVAHAIAQELERESADVVTAIRGRRRWRADYVPTPIDEDGAAPFPLRDRGVYLITGGLGAVGRLMAAQPAESCRARLVLTTREPLPPRASWPDEDGLQAMEPHVADRMRAVRAIEACGAEVRVMMADAADAGAMRDVVAACVGELGRLDGVIHAAGVTSGDSLFQTIQDATPEHCAAQARPKVHGLYAIEQAIDGVPVDFVLAMSSNASVLGGLGFLSYAAANAAMDAFVTARAARPGWTRWLSVNWDHWPQETRKYLDVSSSMDEYAMTREQAAHASRIAWTRCDRGQVIVATGDLQSRLALWVNRDGQTTAMRERGGADAKATAGARPKLRTPYVAPANPIEAQIADIWSAYLGVTPIGANDDFFELGGHSLIAIQLLQEIGRALDCELSLRALFAGPTVAQLARACTTGAVAVD